MLQSWMAWFVVITLRRDDSGEVQYSPKPDRCNRRNECSDVVEQSITTERL